MTNLRWENEIATLKLEIQSLESMVKVNLKDQKLLVLQKRAVILHYQQAMEKMIDKFQRLTRSKIPLPPRQKAIIHWAHVIADKTSRVYQRKSVFWDMTMWQNLIRSRLVGGSPSSEMYIDDHDLIGMATKLNLLKNTENSLGTQLIELREGRKRLNEDHRTTNTRLSNLSAAQSLQTGLATPTQKLSENTLYTTLKSYMNWLTLPLRSSTDQERSFQANYKEVIRKTQNVLSVCRDLAVADLNQPRCRAKDVDSLDKLKEDLARIEHLHSQMDTSINRVFHENAPLPRPVITKSP